MEKIFKTKKELSVYSTLRSSIHHQSDIYIPNEDNLYKILLYENRLTREITVNRLSLYDNPDYVMYIAIDHAKGVTQYGGVVSAPIARNVFKDIISIHDIKEDKEGIPKSYKWDDIKYVMIPDVIGKTKKEAKKLLQGFNVEFTGNGDNVIDTSPNVNTRVKEGSTIKVLLN